MQLGSWGQCPCSPELLAAAGEGSPRLGAFPGRRQRHRRLEKKSVRLLFRNTQASCRERHGGLHGKKSNGNEIWAVTINVNALYPLSGVILVVF